MQIVIALTGDAVFGNGPSEEFPSTNHLEGLNEGSFDLFDLHYFNTDGSCGAAIIGSVHGSFTTKP